MPEINTPPTASGGPQLPPIDPKALVDTAIAVIRNPTDFFRSIKGETGFQKPLVFAIAAGLVYGVIAGVGTFLWAVVGGAFFTAIFGLIGWLIAGVLMGALGAFVGGIVVWAISSAFGSKASWELSVPIAAYSMAVTPVFAVSKLFPGYTLPLLLGGLLGLAGFVYQVYICVQGAKVINFDAPPAPTAPPTA